MVARPAGRSSGTVQSSHHTAGRELRQRSSRCNPLVPSLVFLPIEPLHFNNEQRDARHSDPTSSLSKKASGHKNRTISFATCAEHLAILQQALQPRPGQPQSNCVIRQEPCSSQAGRGAALRTGGPFWADAPYIAQCWNLRAAADDKGWQQRSQGVHHDCTHHVTQLVIQQDSPQLVHSSQAAKLEACRRYS